MKRLEELGISPTPWRVGEAQNYWIEDAHHEMVCDDLTYRGNDKSADDEEHANARLIASAPDMYDALYDVVAYCESTHLVPSERFGKVLVKAKAALAKASGEGEVAK